MTRRRTFRPSRWGFLLLVIAAVAIAADLFLPAGPFPPEEKRVILVQRGQTLRSISDELQRVGLLRGTLTFHMLARAMHLDRSIKAGQYTFALGTTVPGMLRAFARGMSGQNLVTIPEGLTMVEVSLLLSNHLGVPVAAFDSLARDSAFLDTLGITAPTLEGYLAPDSYEFLPGTSPEVAFRTMVSRTQAVLRRSAVGRDSLPLGLSLYELLTLASIVEAEAQVDDERPRIARVYLNRLAMGMRLQADPTVGYAIGGRPRTRLFLRHLRVNSPFNTYLHEGLPPGPICNPGRESIEAVIDPLPDVKDLFFVARGQGRHLFAQTYAEHLENIRSVRSRPGPDTVGPGLSSDSLPLVPARMAGKGRAATTAGSRAVTVASSPRVTVEKSGAVAAKPSPAAGTKPTATKAKPSEPIPVTTAGKSRAPKGRTSRGQNPP